ncbi:DUF4268 domain-containing protein [Nocardioides sp. BP30]|uniref:DUF4268 domain-containing protein n=1 Tax=Nocardioides sp. BP30 TaxID=3036374 RepID=UPI00246923C7|nr:DUF4268 domain-containing protein [Nocardioides sp. BP30]WGL52149.1 DUF4268 domain-containing protein [Nocardioides sp. BP30]
MATTPTALGRIQTVEPRSVWPHEAHDFTPWLLGNVDVLADLLGMNLVLEAAEHPVGDFSLDLVGRNEDTGERVIVENQLEVSDHTHLGQILTYAAGTDPANIVWIATGFRPEHRAAIDWLNSRTDEHTRFFGVQIEVVRIGDSMPAPAFKLVAQPNDWEKAAKTATAGELSARDSLYWEFWDQYRRRVIAEHPGWTSSAGSTKSAWFGMSAGAPGVNWISVFTRAGLAVQLEFTRFDEATNDARFQALQRHQAALEAAYGAPLVWDAVEGRKARKVVALNEGYKDVADREQWTAWIDWLIDTQARFRAAYDHVGGSATFQG